MNGNLDEEKITLQLPAWPPAPDNKLPTAYPDLSRWKITIKSHNPKTDKSFFISSGETSISITAQKNQPLSVTALPITKNNQGQETVFFNAAGFIYPYNCQPCLTWEEGFLANIMEKLISNGNKVGTFNWKKASSIIQEKINNKSEPYNPWLLNEENIMKKITDKKFSATYFNLSSTILYFPEGDLYSSSYLSSFIPENVQKSLENWPILLKKSKPEIFYSSSSTGTIFTYISTKKVSQEHIFLPIYTEEL